MLKKYQHRKNKKLYEFITKSFEFNPYTVYKILQNHSKFLDEDTEESFKIYEAFIEFAANKNNTSLLMKEIRKCMEKEHHDLIRLKFVLKYFPNTPEPSIIDSLR